MRTYVHLQAEHLEVHNIIDILIEKEFFEEEGGCPDDFFAFPQDHDIRKVQEIEIDCENENALPDTLKSEL